MGKWVNMAVVEFESTSLGYRPVSPVGPACKISILALMAHSMEWVAGQLLDMAALAQTSAGLFWPKWLPSSAL